MSASDAQPQARAEAAALGAVYTPRFLADWVADRLFSLLPEKATVADFACGEGVLLEALAARSPRQLELIGADIDPSALRRAKKNLPNGHFKRFDALAAPGDGPAELRSQLNIRRLDGIILNPPWGIEVASERFGLQGGGFKLAFGQYDSADLFLEMAVEALEEGGAAALIIPDSLFFPDHAPMRRFLLERCSLELVARLGEGFFPGVYRGTAILVLRREVPAPKHAVQCLRLSALQRRMVLSGKQTLKQIASAASHRVPQSRFSASASASFDIDLRRSDLRHVRAICRQAASWTQTLTSGRGVELSKHGEVIVCRNCRRARPRPRKSTPILCECGKELAPGRCRSRKIVRMLDKNGGKLWKPLIAGEDVTRYAASPGREIRTDINGINYKPGIDLGCPRLLVRKTGIGLKASLYPGDALTTQTVFHYQSTNESPDFLLAYALGVISSRVMLAVHLKSTGEIEWRSHPYVTQKVLAELPIPHPEPGTQQWKQAKAIAAQASRLADGTTGTDGDLAVESLVAGLYGLTTADVEWVRRVLDETQGLEGVASLRLPPGENPVPVEVD